MAKVPTDDTHDDDLPSTEPELTLEAKCADVIRRSRKPCALHPMPSFAAAKFIALMEPRKEGETRREIQVKGREAFRIEDSYEMRVLQCLRRFLGFSHQQQEMVRIGIEEERVPWRGDDIPFYLRVIEETQKMREMGVDAYRTLALKGLRRLTS